MKILTYGIQKLKQIVRQIEKRKKQNKAKMDQKKPKLYFFYFKMGQRVLLCLTEVAYGISNQRSCHDQFVDYETTIFYLGAKKAKICQIWPLDFSKFFI